MLQGLVSASYLFPRNEDSNRPKEHSVIWIPPVFLGQTFRCSGPSRACSLCVSCAYLTNIYRKVQNQIEEAALVIKQSSPAPVPLQNVLLYLPDKIKWFFFIFLLKLKQSKTDKIRNNLNKKNSSMDLKCMHICKTNVHF